MKIYLSVLLLALLFTVSISQTADDDEVDTSIPGYPYKIYSGIGCIIQDILWLAFWPSPKLFITYSTLHRVTSQMILSYYGSEECLAVPAY